MEVQGGDVVVKEDGGKGSELNSLDCELDAFSNETVLIYGDLLFRTYILNNLMDWDADLLVVVDSSPLEQVQGNTNDLAYCSSPDDRAMYQQKVSLDQISDLDNWQVRQADGRWSGMLRVRGEGRGLRVEDLEQLRGEGRLEDRGVRGLVTRLG